MKVTALQHDTVDAICYRIYGSTAGHVEAVLEANPGLSALGPLLPMGTQVSVPDPADTEATTTTDTINLWD